MTVKDVVLTVISAALFAFAIIVATGCSSSLGRVGLALPTGTASAGPTVSGEDCVWFVGRPSIQQATANALANAPGAVALADAEVTERRGLFTTCYVVKGKAQ